MQLPKAYVSLEHLNRNMEEMLTTAQLDTAMQPNEFKLDNHLDRSVLLSRDLNRLWKEHIYDRVSNRSLAAWFLKSVHCLNYADIARVLGDTPSRHKNDLRTLKAKFNLQYSAESPPLRGKVPRFFESETELNEYLTKLTANYAPRRKVDKSNSDSKNGSKVKEKPLPDVDLAPYRKLIAQHILRNRYRFAPHSIPVEDITSVASARALQALDFGLKKGAEPKHIRNLIRQAIDWSITDEVRKVRGRNGRKITQVTSAKQMEDALPAKVIRNELREKLEAHKRGKVPGYALVIWALKHAAGYKLQEVSKLLLVSPARISHIHSEYFGSIVKRAKN